MAKVKRASEFIQVLRCFTLRRGWNIALYCLSTTISYIFRKPVLWNYPWAATIETSSICQLKCPECALGNGKTNRKNKFIDDKIYKNLIDSLKKNIFWLNLYFQGEPLLDNDIFDKIKLARKNKIFTVVSTNAIAIDDEIADRICASNLNKIIISIDGADEETYLKYRNGGDFYKVLDAISLLDKYKKNKFFPIIEVQMIIFSYNENQKKDIKEIAFERGANTVVFKSPQFYNIENAVKNISHQKKYNRYSKFDGTNNELKSKNKSICNRLWNTIVVNSDAVVCVCCYDKTPDFVMGNLYVDEVYNTWKSFKFMKFRENFLKKDRVNICSNCE